MVELVHYLQGYDFKVYIVFKYQNDEKGSHIVRNEKIASANDKHIKPANIELHIGKKTFFAAGNSNGD